MMDLIEEQKYIRSLQNPREVFVRWDFLCKEYEGNRISSLEFEEIRDTIFDRFREIKT